MRRYIHTNSKYIHSCHLFYGRISLSHFIGETHTHTHTRERRVANARFVACRYARTHFFRHRIGAVAQQIHSASAMHSHHHHHAHCINNNIIWLMLLVRTQNTHTHIEIVLWNRTPHLSLFTIFIYDMLLLAYLWCDLLSSSVVFSFSFFLLVVVNLCVYARMELVALLYGVRGRHQ